MGKRIILRIPDKMYEQINGAIKQDKAKTISELVRAALLHFLTEIQVEEEASK